MSALGAVERTCKRYYSVSIVDKKYVLQDILNQTLMDSYRVHMEQSLDRLGAYLKTVITTPTETNDDRNG